MGASASRSSSRSGGGGVLLTPSTGVRIIVAVVHCFTCRCARAASEDTTYRVEDIDEEELHVDLDEDSDELVEDTPTVVPPPRVSALKK